MLISKIYSKLINCQFMGTFQYIFCTQKKKKGTPKSFISRKVTQQSLKITISSSFVIDVPGMYVQ